MSGDLFAPMTATVPMTKNFLGGGAAGGEVSFRAPKGSPAAAAIRFLTTLTIPAGPLNGQKLKLAPFQKQFVKGALAKDTHVACLSVGRGNAKTALSAGIALGALLGVWDFQPKREILFAARTRDQARIGWDFVDGFIRGLPDDVRKQFTFRRAPRLEIEYAGDGGGHMLRAIAADGKNALGSAPTLAILDERGHWARDKGDALENAILSGLGKRGGRALIISTSAPDDGHPFSKWLDEEQDGVYRQEHRPAIGLPADDLESLLVANPGAKYGIGSSLEWLQARARLSIARGGSALQEFRLLNRNERVAAETSDILITPDQWRACEVSELPSREGQVVVGIDLGGSASMSAVTYYWPETGRLEAFGTFPSRPNLLDRGHIDGVRDRYMEMHRRGELSVLGDKTVPVAPWLVEVMRRIEGEQVAALVMDRFKQSEIGEAIDAAGIRAPMIWRGMGFRDGGEDCERFRRAVFDGKIKALPSLLLYSAFENAVTLRDPANNLKLAKARSTGRIDAASATVLAVAEGARMAGRPAKKSVKVVWA